MSWSREEVILLIEEYRKWPNLYHVKSANYKNRNLRCRALESICQAVGEVKPSVTIQDVQAKFQALKQNASKEKKKCFESQKSGAATDDLIEPSLWYYSMISYVFDDAEPREGIDSLDFEECTEGLELTLIEEGDGNTQAEEVLSAVVSPAGTLENVVNTPSQSRSSSRLSSSSAPQRKKRKRDEEEIMGQVSNTLQCISKGLVTEPIKEKKSANVSDYIVSKLDRIDDEEIRDGAESEIISILNNALKNLEIKNKQ